jgi:hypothetical protein
MTSPLGEEFILIKPLLTGFRAQLEAELKTAMAGITPTVAVQARVAAQTAAAAPRAAAARASQAVETSSVIATANLAKTATATDAVTTANDRLAAAAAKAKTELAGIQLPAGVRDAVSVTNAAAAAQAKYAVETDAAAAAQARLTAAAEKAKLATAARVNATTAIPATVAAEGRSAGGVILPAIDPRANVANTEAAKVQKDLAQTTKLTSAELSTFADKSRVASDASKTLARDVQTAETALGRTSRGLVAATAASTGFFRAVSFASGAFLIGAGIGAAIGSAVQEFKNMTIVGAETTAIIKATGGAANVTAKQVDELAKQQLRLTGTDDELVKKAADVLLTFRNIRNEAGAGNDVFTRSVKAVQDIAAVFNTDLRGSAVQLGKALQDPVRGVTALRRSGITLTQGQRDLIKSLVESGRQLTAEKVILNEVEKQVGGTAAAIGQTLPGRLAILREEAKNSLGELVKRLSESQAATKTFNDTARGVGDAFRSVFPVIKATAGAIAELVKGLQALGILRPLVKTVTLAALAFGALKLAIGITSAAQAAYVSFTTLAATATAAETKTAIAAVAAQAALAEGATTASVALAVQGAAAAGAASRITLGAAAIRGLTNPIFLLTVGLTAGTLGFIKLREAMKNAPGTINATRDALSGLSDAVERQNNLTSSLAGSRENVSVANFDVLAAQRDVNRAQTNVDQSNAQPGSIEQVGLANRLTDATNKLGAAQRALVAAEQHRDSVEAQLAQNQRSRQFIIQSTTKNLQDQAAAVGKFAINSALFGEVKLPKIFGVDFNKQTESNSRRLESFTALMNKLIATGTPLEQKVGRVLRTIELNLGKIPDRKEIALAVKLTGEGLTTDQILSLLGVGRGTEAIRARGVPPPVTFQAQQDEAFKAAQAAVAVEQKRLATLKDINRTRQQDLATSKEQLTAAQDALHAAQEQAAAAKQALADAQQAAGDARQNLTDTIAAGKQALNDAVNSAKANLDSLGQSIANTLSQSGKTLDTTFNAAKFARLRAQILGGGSGPETQQEAERLASQAQSSRATSPVADLTKALGNLTRGLTDHKLTLKQFNTGLDKIATPAAIANIRKTQGDLVADTLLAQIAAIRRQAAIDVRQTSGRGTGVGQTVVDPAQAAKQAVANIVSAQRGVAAAVRGIKSAQQNVQDSNTALVRAEQRLRQSQSAETRANTKAIAANTRVNAELVRLQRTENKKNKAKPNGNDASKSGDLVNHRATSP